MQMIVRRKINEEAPVNNVGGGNIAGVGVGKFGEPGVKKSKYKRDNEKTPMFRRKPAMEVKQGHFAGHKTFVVPNNIFERARLQKRKGGHWTKYLDEDAYGHAIREYANKNPYKPVIFEDEKTGAMVYARYGGESERKRRIIMKENDDINRMLQHDADIQKMLRKPPENPTLTDTVGQQSDQYNRMPEGPVAKGIDQNAGKTPFYDPQGMPSTSTPGFYNGRVMTGPAPKMSPPPRNLREGLFDKVRDVLAKRKASKAVDAKVAASVAKFKANRETKQASSAAGLNRSFEQYHKLVKSRASLDAKQARSVAQRALGRVQDTAGEEQYVKRKTERRDSISAKAATTRAKNQWRKAHGKRKLKRSEIKKWREKIKPKPIREEFDEDELLIEKKSCRHGLIMQANIIQGWFVKPPAPVMDKIY